MGRKTTASGEIGVDWILDPWGVRSSDRKLREGLAEAAEEDVEAAKLTVIARLCQAYLDLRFQQRLLILLEQDRERRRRTLEITQTLLDSGAAIRSEVVRSAARIASIEAEIPDLRTTIEIRKNEIAVLIGVSPGLLDSDVEIKLARKFRQPVAALSGEIGIPADLIRNRPDIRSRERRYYAAVADVTRHPPSGMPFFVKVA